jgi:hypothetical protein
MGFVGKVEYRHVYSQTGGAQYGRGTKDDDDLLTVYAEAFERDADPEDFSLESMIAHERGHQILARHPRIAEWVSGISAQSEEILASLLGVMNCDAARNLVREGRSGIASMRTIRGSDRPSTSKSLETAGGFAMIGTKKLSDIRKEILMSLGQDPIVRLEKIIAKAKRAGERTELTEGLKRFLVRVPKPARRKRRTSAKK